MGERVVVTVDDAASAMGIAVLDLFAHGAEEVAVWREGDGWAVDDERISNMLKGADEYEQIIKTLEGFAADAQDKATQLRGALEAAERNFQAWLMWTEAKVIAPHMATDVIRATQEWLSDPIRAGQALSHTPDTGRLREQRFTNMRDASLADLEVTDEG